ncbi:MAG TPA: hypothetical protein VLA90_06985 [Actinomycetota bacterium]|nr:hypothetical protein [Actinomycetota bacterium]
MTVGELVFANVVDDRVWAAEGERGAAGIYLLSSPGLALPFTVFRAWKIGTGLVTEEVHFYGPSGRLVYRWGPHARRMLGSMDLTLEVDRVEDATFDETGGFLASFVVDGDIVGEIEVPVVVQMAPAKLPREVEDGFRKSDVIWLGVEVHGTRRTVPAWFAYKNGKVYVLSQREPGPEEQTIPGIRTAPTLVLITRRKGRDTSLDELRAAVRLLEGAEWEEAAKALVDRRRSRVGPPADSLQRWRGSCDIAELTLLVA